MPQEPQAEETKPDPMAIAMVIIAADCCDKTAAKALRGEKIRGRVGERVAAAIKALGLGAPK